MTETVVGDTTVPMVSLTTGMSRCMAAATCTGTIGVRRGPA